VIAPKLKRAIGLPVLTLYGLGNILGAGIYVLVGKVAGSAGYAAPLSFLLAFGVAAFTAFSYMELSSRYPKTAGVSVYLHQALKIRGLSTVVGLLLVAAGIVSAATLANGFVGYFNELMVAPSWLVKVIIVTLLAAVALAGITHSARLAALFCVIEVVGLILVVVAGMTKIENVPVVFGQIVTADLWHSGVLLGALLAFYAFIGFEDMVDVIEEVKRPKVTMPRAILLALVISTLLYMAVVVASLLVLTPGELAQSPAPLAEVFARATGQSSRLLAMIGLVAIVGGVLVQIIMGSRVLYGLARQGWIHGSLAAVHEEARTPVLATAVVTVAIIVLAVSLPIVKLAGITSFLTLGVFFLVNLSLLVVKRRQRLKEAHFEVPYWVPVIGLLATAGMAIGSLITAL
jgi:basic amino acid/polyamine antiporter, APA family